MQDIKGKIKVAAAAVAGTLMLGATMAGAVAADLSGLPGPFVQNNQFKGQIVVGENAKVADVIAAAQVAAAFGEYLVSGSASGGSASSDTAFTDDYAVGQQIAKTMTSATYPKLLSFDEVSFTGADGSSHKVKYAEYVQVSGVDVVTGADLSTASDYYDKTAKLFLKVDNTDTVKYYIDFKNNEINNNTVSSDKSVKINFLGQELEITKVESNKITVRTGSKYTAGEGDTVTWNGNTIKVNSVYKNSDGTYGAVFEINGASVSIDSGSKDKVGDVEVNVAKINVPWDASAGSPTVEFYAGTETGKTYTNGDEYIGESSSHPAWKWVITTATSGGDLYLDSLGVIATAKDSLTSSYSEQKPIEEGNALQFPGGSDIVLKAVGHTVTDKVTYTVEESAQDVIITSSSSVGINDGSDYVDKLTFRFNGTDMSTVYIGYTDPVTDELTWTLKTANVADSKASDTEWLTWYFTIGDNENDVRLGLYALNGTTDVYDALVLNFTYDTGSGSNVETATINLTRSGSNVYLGDATDDDSGELILTNYGAVGSAKYDIVNKYGAKFLAGDGTKTVQVEIPKSQDKLKVLIGKDTGDVTTTTVTLTRTALNSAVAVLDSEATTDGSMPLVVVGGPYANSVAASILGTDSATVQDYFGYDATADKGKGVIEFREGESAVGGADVLIVAGWSATDTRAAGYLLGQYLSGAKSLSDLSGKTKVILTATGATSVTDIQTE